MEKLIKRYETAQTALATLNEGIARLNKHRNTEEYDSFRDSAIQRFEYSIDTFWKFIKLQLQEKSLATIETASPKNILREAHSVGLVDKNDFESLIECLDDRNLTSHSYNEDLAEEIVARIPHYYIVMKKILDNIKI